MIIAVQKDKVLPTRVEVSFNLTTDEWILSRVSTFLPFAEWITNYSDNEKRPDIVLCL